MRNFSESYNINQLAKKLEISPGGMFKILKKLQKQNFLVEERLGNNIFYKINYESHDTLDVCKFVLIEKDITPYLQVWIKDLEILKEKTDIAILFGSVLEKGKQARDIDLLLVFNQKNFEDVEGLIEDINKIKSKKVHAIYQTKKDIIKNIKGRDKAILEEIRTGIILWGRDFLVEVIKDGQQ